jgi:hypothetical protein
MSFSDCDPKVNSICFSYFEFVHIWK